MGHARLFLLKTLSWCDAMISYGQMRWFLIAPQTEYVNWKTELSTKIKINMTVPCLSCGYGIRLLMVFVLSISEPWGVFVLPLIFIFIYAICDSICGVCEHVCIHFSSWNIELFIHFGLSQYVYKAIFSAPTLFFIAFFLSTFCIIVMLILLLPLLLSPRVRQRLSLSKAWIFDWKLSVIHQNTIKRM